MENIVCEEKHGKYTIKVYVDETPISPDEWGDDGLFLVAFHRDFTIDRKGFELATMQAVANKGKDENGDKDQEAVDILKKYHVFPLEAYIHSGVVLAIAPEGNFPDRQWDVSSLGLVFVAKDEAKTTAQAKKMAQGLIETWNYCLSGQVYGYVVEDEAGEHVGSCWGFIGDSEECLKEGIDEAKAEEKQYFIKRVKKTKAQILHGVPLLKRS